MDAQTQLVAELYKTLNDAQKQEVCIARFLFKLAVQFGYLVTQLAQFLLCFGRIQITREDHTAVSICHSQAPFPLPAT